MVTIEGQCVLLQNSLRTKVFHYFFKQPKKIVKIMENRPQISKNAQKWITNSKIDDVDKSRLVFGF